MYGAGKTCPISILVKLLLLDLFLLTDTNLGVQVLRILKTFMVVARNRVLQVIIHIGALRQDSHERVGVVAGWAEGPEPLYIRNCHNIYSLARLSRTGIC